MDRSERCFAVPAALRAAPRGPHPTRWVYTQADNGARGWMCDNGIASETNPLPSCWGPRERGLRLSPRESRRPRPSGAFAGQWKKWRVPVKYIVTPAFCAASTTCSSRIEPPGWTIARTPAAMRISGPSGNGKNASEAA